MADYTLTSGQTAKHLLTMVASTEDTVTFPAKRFSCVVTNTSDVDIYVSMNEATAATVGGATTDLVPARSVAKLRWSSADGSPAQAVKVRLISAGAATCSVSAS